MNAKAWRDAIIAAKEPFNLQFDEQKLEQKSPTFEADDWRIAAEHQRQYRTVILRWLGRGSPPQRPSGAEDVPTADRKKGWHFRKPLKPEELESLLSELSRRVAQPTKNAPLTWLLTWNPSLDRWKDLAAAIEAIQTHGFSDGRWNCGRATSVAVGDHVYLQRQGDEPRGICGEGTVIKSAFEGPHWNPEKTGTTHYVMVRWTALLDPAVSQPFDPRHVIDPALAKVKWSTQGSGIKIEPAAAAALENAWDRHLAELQLIQRFSPEQGLMPERCIEGSLVRIYVNRYERDPQARIRCIAHYGTRCAVCSADFEAIYGEIGRGFIHVHHLVPISVRKVDYEVDPIKDLRPVCPNCHAMLHARREPLSIDELRLRLKR